MIARPTFGRRTSATGDFPARLEALGLAVGLAEGRLDADDVAFARHVVDKANVRLRHGTTHTLVALLGATGSGKSSMANAITGSEVATTGVRRPTTSSTLGLVWGEADATGLLDWLEVSNRHLVTAGDARRGGHDLDGLVLLDVPDHDSVAVAHRLEMERIAEHADLLLWVTDPEKYADEAMHHYLQLLSHHGAVTLMVLNKSDRLIGTQLDDCVRDLTRLLVADGIEKPSVFPVSATTGAGVDAVRKRLAQSVADQRAVIERLSADITVAGEALADHIGPAKSTSLDDSTARRLSVDLADASGVEVVAQAAGGSYRKSAAARTGWPVTRWTRRLRPDPLRRLHLDPASRGRSSLPTPTGAQAARAQAAIRLVADEASAGLPEPWPTLFRSAATPPPVTLTDRLDIAVADAVRTHDHRPPRWWSAVGVVQIVLALAALAGGLWLTALAANNWMQLPDFPTPTVWRIPVPTGLFLGGLFGGWVLALLSRQLARLGGKRRAASVRRAAATSVESVADDLVLAPLRAEIARRSELVAHLRRAGADID